ncbi:SGNH/GDSL hydrolase family protein [Leptothrix ochracea]|uniref:SGNH/GDSL hydrolase family protein n=1 Tax=Leptothrix ochracea TaxID=735331 RepID=UPI0034E20E12
MRWQKQVRGLVWGTVVIGTFAAGLVGCGGNATPYTYNRLVVFGDSLSDVGSYRTAGLVTTFTDAGKYTINGPSSTIWVENIATQLGVAAPCAAQTGLESSGPLAGFAEAIANHSGCYDYAQGGARVTATVGPGNKALPAPDSYMGNLTVPVVTQMDNHLAVSSYTNHDLVTVLAGGNDVFMQLAGIASATVTPAAAITAMQQAGDELAAAVLSKVIAKGASRVVVANIPDISLTPYGISLGAATQTVIVQLVQAFNTRLSAGLGNSNRIVLVDLFTESQKQAATPAAYGLSNVTAVACPPPPVNPVKSIGCNATTLVAGQTAATTYEYADDVHPTPYGYKLVSDKVWTDMSLRGWQP